MHPLGLNLDFLFGRGYLSVRGRALGDWATIESLRMEIPDLTFPFDAQGGVDRFRNTRCQVRQIQLSVSESALQAGLGQALDEVRGFEDLRLRFGQGFIQASVRFRTLGSDTFITFKLSAVPPEPARGDELHLFAYDVRAYGPLPYPARMLVSELFARLLATPQLRRPGRDKLYRVEHEGDLVRLRPLKLALMSYFPPHGWKLPGLAGVHFDAIDLHPGALHISARGEGDPWERIAKNPDPDVAMSGPGAASAMAAYEARALCREADRALWDGQLEASIEVLHGLRERYGLHPALVARMLDAMLASSGTGHLAEARALAEELRRADPDNLHALLAAPTLALLRGDTAEAADRYELLAEVLRRRGEQVELVACLLAAAMARQRHDPRAAVALLREVVQLAPRHRLALELLRDLYTELDQPERAIDALRHLASLYTERDSLLEVYQRLADALMAQGDLGEARLYLERILRLDPMRLASLHSLGESYMLDGQPLRALKAFGSAARAAERDGQPEIAARLHLRIAQLWAEPLGDAEGALLSCRRALELVPEHRKALELGLEVSVGLGRHDDALEFIEALTPQIEREVEQTRGQPGAGEALRQARRLHLTAAAVSESRGRPETAAAHHRRALTWRRTAGYPEVVEDDPSVKALDAWYRAMGRPEDLLDLYRAELDDPHIAGKTRAALHRDLARIHDQVLGLGSEAAVHLRQALEHDPEDVDALEMAVDVMMRAGLYFELLDLLTELDQRVQDRRLRGLIQRHTGALHLDALPEANAAARLLRQAQRLRPADPEAARLLVRAERALLDKDPHADQRPLLKALERLGELGGEDEVRHAALLEAADIAYGVLDNPTMAAGLYQRAHALIPTPRATERLARIHARTGYVDAPAPVAIEPTPRALPVELPSQVTAAPPPANALANTETTSAEAMDAEAMDVEAMDVEVMDAGTAGGEATGFEATDDAQASGVSPGTVEPQALQGPTADDAQGAPSVSFQQEATPNQGVSTFRQQLQQVQTAPTDLKEGLSVLDRLKPTNLKPRQGGPRLRVFEDDALPPDAPTPAAGIPALKRPGSTPTPPPRPSSPAVEPVAPSEGVAAQGTSVTEPVEKQEDLLKTRAVSRLMLPLEEFSEAVDGILGHHGVPDSLDGAGDSSDDSAAGGDAVPDVLEVMVPTPPPESIPTPRAGRLPLQEQITRPVPTLPRPEPVDDRPRRLEQLLNEVSQAREGGDPSVLRDALERAIDDEVLTRETRARFLRELGMLYYYDLEQIPAAEERLTRAMEIDPDGAGQDLDVLTALEGIYEDLGRPEQLLEVYRQKRALASDPSMRRVYALLAAELLWERLERPHEAIEALESVIETDIDNVPALRMMAEISHQLGDTARAVAHLQQLVDGQPSGTFDLQDALRDLGRILIDHLSVADDDPQATPSAQEAREHAVVTYRRLMVEAPGDSTAIAALKPLYEQLGRLDEALATLGLELSLLLGRRGAFPAGPTPEDIDPSQIAPALAIPVSQILAEAASLEERLGDVQAAQALSGLAVEAWPENIDALTMHLDLLRRALTMDVPQEANSHAEALATGLESMASMMLDPADQFAALHEAAEVRLERLEDTAGGAALLAEALALASNIEAPTPSLAMKLDRARKRLVRLGDGSPPSVDVSPPTMDLALEHLPEPISPPEGVGTLMPPDEPPTQEFDEAIDLAQAQSLQTISRPPSPPRGLNPPLQRKRDERRAHNPFGLPPTTPFSGPLPPDALPSSSGNANVFDDFDPEDHRSITSGDWADLAPDPDAPAPWEMELPDALEPDPALTAALERAQNAEQARDRDLLIAALAQAVRATRSAEDAPSALRRQLLVRLAEALLGLRPEPGARPWTITPEEQERALSLSEQALALEDCDEPEAHFARSAALRALGRQAEALEALERLARAANHWQAFDDDFFQEDPEDEEDLEVEQRLLDESVQILKEMGEEARRQQTLDTLAALNPRFARLLERQRQG